MRARWIVICLVLLWIAAAVALTMNVVAYFAALRVERRMDDMERRIGDVEPIHTEK